MGCYLEVMGLHHGVGWHLEEVMRLHLVVVECHLEVVGWHLGAGWRMELVAWHREDLKVTWKTSSLLSSTVKDQKRSPVREEEIGGEEEKEELEVAWKLSTGQVLLEDKLFLGNPIFAATPTKVHL